MGNGTIPTVRTLFCGFGPSAQSAAKLLLRRGQAPESMRVAEPGSGCRAAAEQMRIPCADWPANELPAVLGPSVTRVIVDLDEELRAEPLVRALRAALPGAAIMVALRDATLTPAILRSGASGVIDQARIAGSLLAETVTGTNPADTVTQ